MIRKNEYFKITNKLDFKKSVNKKYNKFYRQLRDWTCSIACIRTILSNFNVKEDEEFYINTFKLSPGPYFSKDIKQKKILNGLDVIYGCDKKNVKLSYVLKLLDDNYGVMLESMYNYAHWMVLISYKNINNDIEESKLTLYDPYYDENRVIRVDEFINMWQDGDYYKNKVKNDFIAIKGK